MAQIPHQTKSHHHDHQRGEEGQQPQGFLFFILKNRKTLAAPAGFRKDFLYAFAPFASVCF
jgi:hypothetical protein